MFWDTKTSKETKHLAFFGQISQLPNFGTISGNVTDQDGNALEGVTLPNLLNVDGNPIISDANGNFPGDIPNGPYTTDKVIYNGAEWTVSPTIEININGGVVNIGTVIVNRKKSRAYR
jgi:hypothetical protein